MTSWNRTALLEFSTRLRLCCDELWEWGAKFRRRFSRRKQIFRVRMNQYRGSVTTMGQTLFSSACREYGLLPDQEHSYWKQRAKQHWLQEGDMNSLFSIRLLMPDVLKTHLSILSLIWVSVQIGKVDQSFNSVLFYGIIYIIDGGCL